MLKTLKRIVQKITTVQRLSEALSILVHELINALSAEAVSVYLIDNKNAEYVLIATEGLNKKAEYKVRVPLENGLIGTIGRREEPLNIDDANLHPEFYRNPLLKEENFHAYLGVPIIQHRKLYGVLIAQREEARYFDDSEEAFLITLAAQLGGIISQAEATGELNRVTSPKIRQHDVEPKGQLSLKGTGSIPGVGIGRALVIYPRAKLDSVPKKTITDVEAETLLFYNALIDARDVINKLSKRISNNIDASELAIFDVYLKIMDKDALGKEVADVIASEQVNAKWALSSVIKKHMQQFENFSDPYLKDRAMDFKDLGSRILAELEAYEKTEIDYPDRTVLIGDEISASDLAMAPEGKLKGIVSAYGSTNSHVAILARALGIPCVFGARGINYETLEKRAIIVDGYYGHVFISPAKALLQEYKTLEQEEDELNHRLVSLRDKPCETIDSHVVKLYVNIGLAMDAGLSMSVGAEGVGLYRSEVPFMSKDRFPSEDEQYIIYRQILKAFAPRPVTMRTLDIGADKILSYFPIEEDNPYLGWRGIRITLDHPEIFILQIRAMLRANEGLNNLRIMLPMITSLSEIDETLYLIEQAYGELLEEGYDIEKPEIGVMIEVPAAVFQAKEIAKKVDFLSVGSNDLTQYLLAIDRNNQRVQSLYESLHPSMLKALIKIVEGAHSQGKEVSICGEMASDPMVAILLVAMGFDSLSMNSFSLPRIKWVIRNIAMANARKFLADVLEFDNAKKIKLYLQQILEDEGLAGLIRAGKS